MRRTLKLMTILLGLTVGTAAAEAGVGTQIPAPQKALKNSRTPVPCELMVRGRWPLERAAQVFHARLADQSFKLSFLQLSVASASSLSMHDLADEDFQNIELRVEENLNEKNRSPYEGDYNAQFVVDGKIVSTIGLDAPPISSWVSKSGTRQQIEKRLTAPGPEYLLQPVNIEDRVLAVYLKTKTMSRNYLAVNQDSLTGEKTVEIGAYVSCRSPELRDMIEVTPIRLADGWQCRLPLMRFN